ncbi:ABC transporter transmembrane domain-containing protein [Streptomyces sp. NPDC059679]|uniref:ABC transporter transmembrane domain-containing protein n=1 Tax=Streptomyces sp. NPDC059679 TaxID=3346903 RepID=UPI0036CB5048
MSTSVCAVRKSDTDPGVPDSRSAGRYLWWLITSQRHRIVTGSLLGSLWMVGLTLPPYLLSRAIDDGLVPGRSGAFMGWVAVLLGVGVLNAWLGIMRHRTMTKVRMDAVFRTVRSVVGQATRLGAELPRHVTAGEVVTIGISDVWRISQTLTITGPGVGAALAYVVVAGLLFSVSVLLAVVVLLGVPLLAVLVGPLLGRLQSVETAYRAHQGTLTARFVDMAGGLRVLNGLGGKSMYAQRYGRESRQLMAEGYRVGAVTSWIQALGVGLPTLFLAAVTWLAARLAAQGSISVGELVAVYGYVAVLVVPVSFFIEGGYDLGRGLVAARQVIRFLNLRPERPDAIPAATPPPTPSELHDPDSGVTVAPGELTALVGAVAAETSLVVDRLAGFVDSAAVWGGTRLDACARADLRARIVVADNEADLFSGPLREVISGRHDRDERTLASAVHTAAAQDIVHALPDGLEAAVTAQGGNLSGGQRQRIRLARALAADPEVLLATEPTSAVDAHTEAVVAARLRAARSGRTTLVTTTSPLLLDHADTVYYLVDGVAAAFGSHRELLCSQPGYRRLVSRGGEDEDGDESGDGDGDGDTTHDDRRPGPSARPSERTAR